MVPESIRNKTARVVGDGVCSLPPAEDFSRHIRTIGYRYDKENVNELKCKSCEQHLDSDQSGRPVSLSSLSRQWSRKQKRLNPYTGYEIVGKILKKRNSSEPLDL